jgi:para-nitrobenzyl esterase
MRLWNLWYPVVKDHEELKKRVSVILGPSGKDEKLVDRIIQTYETGRENPNDIYTAINTDSFFRIPAIRVAEAQMKHNPNTYMYMFTYPSPMQNGKLGACHAIEIPFVHGTLNMPRNELFPASNNETETISKKMMDAWTSFAKTGNPNHKDIPEWHPYSNNRATIMFDTKVEIKNDPFGEERAVWDDIIKFKD